MSFIYIQINVGEHISAQQIVLLFIENEMRCMGFLLALAKDVGSLQGLIKKQPTNQPTVGFFSFVVPRQPTNDLFEIFEIERGVSADEEVKDDPGRHCYVPILTPHPRKIT